MSRARPDSVPGAGADPLPAPPLWEQVAAGFVIVMLTGALIGPVFAPDQGETPILRLIWLPVYAVTLGLILNRAGRMFAAWPAWLILGLLTLLALASRYWSIDPGVTDRRVIALFMTSAFAIYLGAAFTGAQLPRLLMHTGVVMAVGSLVMVLAFPSIGIHQFDNAGLWRGLWYEKNQMGIVMVASSIAAAAVLASPGQAGRSPWPALFTLMLCVFLTLATQSKTSLLSLLLGLGVIGGLWAMRRGGPALSVVLVWGAITCAGIGLLVWQQNSALILEALGKDPSLTGRTDIWESLMRRVAERPWTGYGYSAFWGKESVPAHYVRLETGWLVPSAHNGWIDLLVQVGWPGAIMVGLVMLITLIALIVRLGGQGFREGGFSLAYLLVFAVLSASESVLLSHANLPWALFLALTARALTPDPLPRRHRVTVPLARRREGAYLTSPRIVSN
ncbi:O-antigen ligase family protein [Brevundimonas poindexterae]|uniref:O-antigen ligase family protein n=1 Tax=Brevundimonas poindexterae TaxID=74325 RepID=UPI001CFD2527|nr:O-antigen ligase family protein [Brevundimonas poindexterae]